MPESHIEIVEVRVLILIDGNLTCVIERCLLHLILSCRLLILREREILGGVHLTLVVVDGGGMMCGAMISALTACQRLLLFVLLTRIGTSATITAPRDYDHLPSLIIIFFLQLIFKVDRFTSVAGEFLQLNILLVT